MIARRALPLRASSIADMISAGARVYASQPGLVIQVPAALVTIMKSASSARRYSSAMAKNVLASPASSGFGSIARNTGSSVTMRSRAAEESPWLSTR